ncbi:Fe-S cluster assembly protein SufB [Gordonia defluvii]|jgi:Fe-S cluster assembly protein SufB|uniref:Fe-S cluster assembly protein SufB n=1 Tax=Gordonia defluvii TaxID=283718 RepID=A0ABP6LGQ7_9ACTN
MTLTEPTSPATGAAAPPLTQDETIASLGTYGYGWADSDEAGAAAQRGLSEAVVADISGKKNEPAWMLEQRLKALRIFDRKPMPTWGADLGGIDFDNIKYFVRSTEKQAESWEDLPEDIRNTYDRLGIPEAEKQRLVAGVAAQYESEVVYHQIREDLEEKGVIFLDTDSGLREHPEVFQQYFGSVIPAGDNKFSALNTAVWSGGSFVYVPPGVHVEIPLQAYFRINTENMGQFERTLIIVDEDAYVHYVEGCTAPIYKSDSLHSAVVEIVVKKGGRCRYTTIQNWSNNVYNLVTKRAKAEAGATMEWVDGNIGSKVTMKYPAVWLTGEHAKGEVLSVAFAGPGQHQDTGSKMVHLAPNTSSNIVSKSVARGGGRSSYRGLIKINPGAHGSRSTVKCDALLVDQISRSDTYPYVDIREDDVTMGHEATVSKVSDDQLFYLMSRGLTEDEAMAMVVRGFVEPIAKELPMEYALELNRLIELQMEGSVG